MVLLTAALTACGGKSQTEVEVKEDLTAKQLLQGIWLDDDTELPLLRVEGDSIYYADPQNMPAAFRVVHDSIYVIGNTTAAYKIDRQTEYSFWFHSLDDEIVKLHKSENVEDALAFAAREVEVIPTVQEVIQKDSVVMFQGTRYRGYVYINPSQMKVVKTSLNENGISVDNVYYDNVIHICVYEGAKLLYGKDITKKEFASIFSDDFLGQTILTDMEFMGVDGEGYHYQATLCIPESPVCNLVNVTISYDSQLTFQLKEG
ncbi:MAG: DUF4738 domain-containing protein [Bacteroides sp.]